MNTIKLSLLSLLTAAALGGCATAQQYEVTGEVTSAVSVSGPIQLEFFEQDANDDAAERASIKQVEIATPGSFSENVAVSAGSKLIVRALVDTDQDGHCTTGELWAEAEIAELTTDVPLAPVQLVLDAVACPAE